MRGLMSHTRRQYPFHLIEPRWQERWESGQLFRAWNPGDTVPAGHPFHERHGGDSLPPKYFALDMFPYPSGAGLHVGHPEGYIATDIMSRYRRARGFNVLHPIGWDAFGLPAEQYAIRTGQHPRITTEANIANFKRQIRSLGFSYDWSREINTTDPGYFRWTQWIFLQIYHAWFNPESQRAEPIDTLPLPPELTSESEQRAYRDRHRLAYVSEAPVWWCEELGTVLANEEVIDGTSEVGGFPVVRRPMRQWVLRITAYAERLLQDLEPIDWSHSLKEMQRNWIGRSEGAEVHFPMAEGNDTLTVFTTRPDTLFGATYMVLSPEHAWVSRITEDSRKPDVLDYQRAAAGKSDLDRTDLAKDKTGVFTGAYAVNPVNQEKIPIWIADYVLASYGTGAIMAVPAHDSRDLEFARKFNLPVREVVQAPDGTENLGFVGDGVSIHSDFLNGLRTPEAKKAITEWLEDRKAGRRTIHYKLRDWLFSRQRYWGEPFPIVWKTDENRRPYHEALPESELPLLPPELDDYKPTPDGDPPLARASGWVTVSEGVLRETNTMPQWAGSCWYYLRYMDARNDQALSGPQAEAYWLGASADSSPGVDLYIGGTEHAVLHLLYARFWHKILFDLGHVSTPEPFFKLVNQGIILGEDGQKMSKSRGNVINPDDILGEFGADAFRLYEMFLGPLEMVKPWNTKGVEGVYRFLGRTWRLFVDEASEQALEQHLTESGSADASALDLIRFKAGITDIAPTPDQSKALHACIKKVTEDIEGMRFNTAISALMVFINEAMTWKTWPVSVLRSFLILLQPFAPHLAEELASRLPGASGTLAYQPWPAYDPALLVEDTLELPVQVNGKLRGRIQVPVDADREILEAAALKCEKVLPFLEGKTVRNVIVVPKKLVNVVAV